MDKLIVVPSGTAKALAVLGVELRFLCRPEDTGGAWSLMENIIPRNAGPPPHHHNWAEAYYVTSGAVDFEIEGRPMRVSAGDFVYAPANTVHGFKGASDEPARMLVFDAPAHAAKFFEEVDQQVRTVPDDCGKIPSIGERNGIFFEAA